MPIQKLTPPLLTDSQWARAFRQKEGTTRRTSTVSSAVILKSVVGRLLSVIMMILSTVSLQFQGQFVPIS